MANIESIVDVIISLATRPITTAGFETPLFISAHKVFAERYRVYSTLQGVLDDGFDSDSEVGKAVSVLFSQPAKPAQVIIGRRDYTTETLVVAGTVQAGDTISVQIAGSDTGSKGKSTITITSTGTAATDATALAQAISDDVTITPYVDAAAVAETVTLTRAVGAEVTFVGEQTSNLSLVLTDLEDMDDAIVAITAEKDDYFFIASDSRVQADILDLAAYAQANKRMYGVALYEADILIEATTTDTLSLLNTAQYDNVFVLPQLEAQSGQYHEMAAIGTMASLNAGTSTLHGKTLIGVDFMNFTDSQIASIQAKKGSAYVRIAGVGFLLDGFCTSGQFFDTIRGSLWLEARLQEDIFGLIKRESDAGRKIPYTNTGIAMVKQVMETRLAQAVNRGFLSDDAGREPFVDAPLVEEIPENDRANRFLPDIPFTAYLAGAIHRVKVRGYVQV